MPASPIRVALIEDQRATREGLAQLVGAQDGLRLVGAFESVEAAQSGFGSEEPEVLLCDIHLPGVSGIEGVKILRKRFPRLQVLMLTVFGDHEHVFEAICAGACGYLLKDTPPERLLEAIHELHSGGAPMSPEIARKVVATFARTPKPGDERDRLTEREMELLRLLAEGHSYKTAARAMSLAIDTVRFHVRNVYEKLHVHSKSEAVALALRRGLVK